VITSRRQIYFYKIKETKDNYLGPSYFKPVLDNVIYNFMTCNMMIFGPKLTVCITYEIGSEDFRIFSRNFKHNFQVKIDNHTGENNCNLNLKKQNAYCIANYSVSTYNTLKIYSQTDFKLVKELDCPTLN